ncbi:MAG: SDR family oxidoreductase, partial [bacterium]
MNKTYLITGGTGFMGSQLAKKILESGNRVIFVGRQKRGENYQNRIREQYKSYDANLTETLEVDLEVIDSNDLINKIVSISSKLDGIWHLAANLSFKDSDRNQVFAANKNSTSTIIKVAKKFNTTLYHTSTAYVHGRGSGTSMEEFNLKPKYFNNPYEESKYEAEQLIKNSTDLKYVIFRPSILYDRHGEYISVVLGSRSISEGYSFKNILEEHIITPHYNYAEIDQSIARGFRFKSHTHLIQDCKKKLNDIGYNYNLDNLEDINQVIEDCKNNDIEFPVLKIFQYVAVSNDKKTPSVDIE